MSDASRCAGAEGTTPFHTSDFSGGLFDVLERRDTGDYHGATPHEGRLRCRACGATFRYESTLSSTTVTRETR